MFCSLQLLQSLKPADLVARVNNVEIKGILTTMREIEGQKKFRTTYALLEGSYFPLGPGLERRYARA